MNVIPARVVSSLSSASSVATVRQMAGLMLRPYQQQVPLTATGSTIMIWKKTTAMAPSPISSLAGVIPSFSCSPFSSSPLSGVVRWKSSNSNGDRNLKKSMKAFRPRRTPDTDYVTSVRKATNKKKSTKGKKGPKDPNDVSTSFPKIDFSNIRITETVDEGNEVVSDDPTVNPFVDDPLMSSAIEMLRAGAASRNNNSTFATTTSGNELDIESQLKMMDFFTSAPGSTEDLVGARRAVALEALEGEDPDQILQKIDEIVEQERLRYMDLPPTELITLDEMNNESSTGSTRIPPNQLAHGDWCVLICVCVCVYFCLTLDSLLFWFHPFSIQ